VQPRFYGYFTLPVCWARLKYYRTIAVNENRQDVSKYVDVNKQN